MKILAQTKFVLIFFPMVHSFHSFSDIIAISLNYFCPVFQVKENETDHWKFSFAFYLLILLLFSDIFLGVELASTLNIV